MLLPQATLTITESKAVQLLDGIDRICPEQRSSNLLVLHYDGEVAVDLLAVSRRRPVYVQNSNFSGTKQPWFTKCIVGFFSSTDAFKSAQSRLPLSVTRILVIPESQLDAFVMLEPSHDTCWIPIYHYDPQNLNGSWLIYYSRERNYSMESLENFQRDMQGYSIGYVNTDFMRDTSYDREIGKTIAQNHNGSFKLMQGQGITQGIDYFYGVLYMGRNDYIVLPEVSELCFLVPRSSPLSVFWVLLDPYDVFGWIAFGVTVCMVALVLARFGESLRRYGVVLITLEILMSVINGPTHKFHGPFEKRVVGLFLLLCIVLISGYQSLVISFISAPRYEPELDTLEQINDTCFFQYDPYLVNLGYNFKNSYDTYPEDSSFENSWKRKLCAVLPCSEAQVIKVNLEGETSDRMEGLGIFSEEELELVKEQMKYFRYSKARMLPIVAMYQAAFDSPVRPLVERYTRAFVEGQLYYFPTLSKTKHDAREYSPRVMRVDKMGPRDLLIIWVIYVLGVLVSVISFVAEMGVLGVRKLKSVQWKKKWNTIKHIRKRSLGALPTTTSTNPTVSSPPGNEEAKRSPKPNRKTNRSRKRSTTCAFDGMLLNAREKPSALAR
uniref:Ionotropic glutamate receptor C-terminal domain-containing protein n=1 Tax=Anopheles atroparvus TaxID=41427 RepID=A0A182JMC4_ANOAO